LFPARQWFLDALIDAPLPNVQATLEAIRKMFLSSEKKSKKTKTHQQQPLSEDEPPPIDVLVDVMIGYLEKASAFARSVASESFSRVTSAVQGSTIDLILSVSDFLLGLAC
jgi:DNA polymerase phi